MNRNVRIFNAFYLPNIDAITAEKMTQAFLAGDQVEVGRLMCEHVTGEVEEAEQRDALTRRLAVAS